MIIISKYLQLCIILLNKYIIYTNNTNNTNNTTNTTNTSTIYNSTYEYNLYDNIYIEFQKYNNKEFLYYLNEIH